MDIIALLVKQGLIAPEQIERAKEEVKRTGITLERALEKLGFVNEEDIAKVKSVALGVPYMDLTDYIIDAELTKLIPENLAKKYKVVPIFKTRDNLTVAMTEPHNIEVLDQIRKLSKINNIEPVLVSPRGIQRILDSYYEVAGSAQEVIKSFEQGKFAGLKLKGESVEVAEEPPIIKLVNLFIMEAVKERASDIHIEPEEDILRVRFRIDGILHEIYTMPLQLRSAVTSRIKILSGMDIAENRRPQDGKIRMRLENSELNIRVSTFPTVHGENVVMRLLDNTLVLLGLKDLGFSPQNLETFEKLIRQPNGIILVTGPTGSGKTTTLYSAITTISSMEKNIITIEDPVEYELPLIRQTQVNPKADITFANGLRSILRQDPDVVMVGEIRDKETAEIAIQAALTGHLVFSTLHTNDAPSALTRLVDMGIEPFLIASSVIGIVAQRLVRSICPKCKEGYSPPATLLKELGIEEKIVFYRGKGCSDCRENGLVGRTGIFELLIIGEDIRRMIEAKNSADEIKKRAVELRMQTLRDDGLEKAQRGITTVEEVLRVTEVE